jgi:hypothetical protein
MRCCLAVLCALLLGALGCSVPDATVAPPEATVAPPEALAAPAVSAAVWGEVPKQCA